MPFWVCRLKSVKATFDMECDQRVIVKFLWNEAADARDIADRLQAQCAEYGYYLRTVHFWITEIQLGHQDLHGEIHTGRPPLDHLDMIILARLTISPFKLAHSIAERPYIASPAVVL
jgi:hypothetical protein